MSVDRRDFLKMAGVATALGLAGTSRAGTLLGKVGSTRPGPEAMTAHRWAMVIDLRKMTEETIDRCAEACHVAHNVPDFGNAKDEIKWIWAEPYHNSFPAQENHHTKEELAHRMVPVLCNHCDNPPCVRVCPTQATWRREDGIVMMDWHRCIGCRYCITACPYGSRSFNWRDPRPHIAEIDPTFPTRERGVVEKCTFCNERLARGQQPACVEACTGHEIVFGDLEDPDSEVRHLLAENFTIRRKTGLGTQPEIYYIV
jgi:molybdopterin-containing oxidoreductase family iron-sulfur binding subunit